MPRMTTAKSLELQSFCRAPLDSWRRNGRKLLSLHSVGKGRSNDHGGDVRLYRCRPLNYHSGAEEENHGHV